MELSLLLAQVMGLYLILEGLTVLTRKKFVMNIVNDMSQHRALMFVTGAMIFVLGLLVVLNHNVWDGTWRVVPTVIGWAMVVKGVAIFMLPDAVIAKAKRIAKNHNLARMLGIIAVAVGLYLAYIGFGLGA